MTDWHQTATYTVASALSLCSIALFVCALVCYLDAQASQPATSEPSPTTLPDSSQPETMPTSTPDTSDQSTTSTESTTTTSSNTTTPAATTSTTTRPARTSTTTETSTTETTTMDPGNDTNDTTTESSTTPFLQVPLNILVKRKPKRGLVNMLRSLVADYYDV